MSKKFDRINARKYGVGWAKEETMTKTKDPTMMIEKAKRKLANHKLKQALKIPSPFNNHYGIF